LRFRNFTIECSHAFSQSVLIAPKCLYAVTQGVERWSAFGHTPLGRRRLLPQHRRNLGGAVDHHRLWAGMADHSEAPATAR
jgi:hypothetical protein